MTELNLQQIKDISGCYFVSQIDGVNFDPNLIQILSINNTGIRYLLNNKWVEYKDWDESNHKIFLDKTYQDNKMKKESLYYGISVSLDNNNHYIFEETLYVNKDSKYLKKDGEQATKFKLHRFLQKFTDHENLYKNPLINAIYSKKMSSYGESIEFEEMMTDDFIKNNYFILNDDIESNYYKYVDLMIDKSYNYNNYGNIDEIKNLKIKNGGNPFVQLINYFTYKLNNKKEKETYMNIIIELQKKYKTYNVDIGRNKGGLLQIQELKDIIKYLENALKSAEETHEKRSSKRKTNFNTLFLSLRDK